MTFFVVIAGALFTGAFLYLFTDLVDDESHEDS
jgi:hypothetical protein